MLVALEKHVHCFIACVGNVSNRIITRTLEREQKTLKKGRGFPLSSTPETLHCSYFALVPTFLTNCARLRLLRRLIALLNVYYQGVPNQVRNSRKSQGLGGGWNSRGVGGPKYKCPPWGVLWDTQCTHIFPVNFRKPFSPILHSNITASLRSVVKFFLLLFLFVRKRDVPFSAT